MGNTTFFLRGQQKTEKLINPRKQTKITEKTKPLKKNILNRLEYLKKYSVLISLKPKNRVELNQKNKKTKWKKTEPNQNQAH